MKRDSGYYYLSSPSMSSAESDKSWFEKFKADHPTCAGCSAHQDEWGAVDAVVSYMPKGRHFGGLRADDIGFMSRDLLACFSDQEIARGLHVGRLLDTNGNELERYCTVRGKHSLTVRGDDQSEYRKCEVCGRDVYFPITRFYILPHSIARQEPIYEAASGFAVNEEIYKRISSKRWRGARIDPLPLRDKPIDGMPDLLI